MNFHRFHVIFITISQSHNLHHHLSKLYPFHVILNAGVAEPEPELFIEHTNICSQRLYNHLCSVEEILTLHVFECIYMSFFAHYVIAELLFQILLDLKP